MTQSTTKWMFKGLYATSLALGVAMSVLPSGADAALINGTACTTTGTSGGNPGGLPVETCYNVEQGDTITFGNSFSSGIDDLSFEGSLFVATLNATTLVFDWRLTNLGEGQITHFGVSIDTATGASISPLTLVNTDAGATLDKISTSNFPGFQLLVDACLTSGNNCAGGGGQGGIDGLATGESDSGTVTVLANFSNGLSLDTFATKFQATPSGASYEIPGNGGTPPDDVPEPASLAIFGAGLLSLSYATRRRRHDTTV